MPPSKVIKGSPSTPLSSTTLTAIKVLSLIRIATGAGCLIAPRFTCSLHYHDVPADQAFIVRMVGVREGLVGALLFSAEDKGTGDGGRRAIRRAVWAGIIADAVDIGSLTFGFIMGEVGKPMAGIIGTAAVGAISLAALILRGL
ncbi:uncharacterized protein B0H64DRAFT_20278 [Chaetomium fimeti]|uniref:Uncharacterized protein n=1 Tax=Chaetomium fimeti TaxID=1854472 RepID=A0AAE0LXU3_9PEZI|nr:hypothetical protein B0H64DRAFT_20278 [Chaetomium fimeti]